MRASVLGLQAWSALGALLPTLLGCSSDQGERRTRWRLIDAARTQTVESPLLAREPVSEPRVVDHLVLDRAALGSILDRSSSQPRGCEVPPTGDSLLSCRGSFLAQLDFPVEPSSRYRFAALVAPEGGGGSGCADFVLQEFRQAGVPLARGSTDGGVALAADFLTGYSSRTLRFVTRSSRSDCQIRLDRLALERLEVERSDLVARLLAEPVELDPAMPAARRGFFLPVGEVTKARPPFEDNFSAREVLVAMPPTRFSARLVVPDAGRFETAWGFHRFSTPGAAADVRVEIADSEERITLFERTLEVAPATWHWHELTLDLTPWAGRSVTLDLVTEASDRGGAGEAIVLWSQPAVSGAAEGDRRPNVVLVAIDTLRADRLSHTGTDHAKTVAIDDLAERAMTFRRAYSTSNWTLPAFASIFTGTVVQNHGVLEFGDRIPPRLPTLAERFRDAGWRTAAVVIKPTLYMGSGMERGFEDYFNLPLGSVVGTRNLSKASGWLERHHDERFFLFVHFNDPHQPFTHPDDAVSADSRRQLEHLGIELPVNFERAWEACRECREDPELDRAWKRLGRQLYDEEVEFVDRQIGRLLAEIEALGLADDTVIALVSDHGETLWENYDTYGHGGRGHHDNLVKVPMMVYRPGATPLAVEQPVSVLELAPTLLELAGIEGDRDRFDGTSLTRFARGSTDEETTVFTYGSEGESARRGEWVYRREIVPGRDAPEGLFALDAAEPDPEDRRAEHPEIFESLRAEAVTRSLTSGDSGIVVLATTEKDSDCAISLTSAGETRWNLIAPYGVPLRRGDSGAPSTWEFAGRTAGRLALAVKGRIEGGTVLDVDATGCGLGAESLAVKQIERADPRAVVARLLGDSRNRLAVFRHETARGDDAGLRGELDPQQLEALRALGYLD